MVILPKHAELSLNSAGEYPITGSSESRSVRQTAV